MHPDDSHLFDNVTFWWFEWYEYHVDDRNSPVYGTRMIFGPKWKPKQNKYIVWTDSVNLTSSSCYIRELFNCDSCFDVISTKTIIFKSLGSIVPQIFQPSLILFLRQI